MDIEKKEKLIKRLNSRCAYNIHNHIVVRDVDDDSSVVEVEMQPESLNPLGMAHGGLVYSLCDVAAGVILSPKTDNFVTLSGNLYFMRPGRGSKLRCEAKLIKPGRTVNVVETSVYDDSGTMTARGVFEIYAMSSAK